MSSHQLPATAVCPGCGTIVVLPAEPRNAEDDPLICGTCGAEVPDHRLEQLAQAAEAQAAAEEEAKPENRVYTRRGLLQGLRDAAAERVGQAARELGERAKF